MIDLKLTKLCAEAMGYTLHQFEKRVWILSGSEAIGDKEYMPLSDDAQAMALVKRFELRLAKFLRKDVWLVEDKWERNSTNNHDLNYAICECVAKMQLAKVEADRRFGQPHYGHNREST